MEKLLTMQQVKERYQFKDNRIIHKLMKKGLRFIKIGNEYRFDIKDIEKFEEQLKDESQIIIKPIKQKRRFKTIEIDEEKRRINLTEMRVI